VRRNKIVFAAGGAVALALLMGMGLSTWLFFREREARFQEHDAREREAHLRAEAEDRAKIEQAVMFVSQGKYDDADGVLNQVKNFPANPTLDGISAYRSVGEWLALQGHWQLASERYSALVNIDKLDSLGRVILDYQAFGVILAENGDREQYNRYWQMTVTNFATAPNASVLLACDLLPLNKSQIEMLKPIAVASEQQINSIPKKHQSDWTFVPFGLWQFRCGNYDAALRWCQRAEAQSIRFPCCDAIVHTISAMSYYQLGQTNEAGSELAQAQQLIGEKFKSSLDRGQAGTAFWFDWVYARHLLQEATALINSDPERTDTE
jgi:hypothetical protein